MIRGKFNEILTNDIHPSSIISGWCFLGRGVHIGKNCIISNYVELNSDAWVGDNVSIQPKCVFNSNTRINDNTMIGAYVVTADEKYMDPKMPLSLRRPCVFGKNVRVGTHSIIVSSHIGDNAIIGANTMVLNDVPENEVWVGSPARPLCSKTGVKITRFDIDKKMNQYLNI